MALAVQRDPDRVTGGFVEWLRDREPDQSIDAVGFERPTDGFSSETYLVDVRRADDAGTRDERVVLRLPPLGPGIFPAYDLAQQARAQEVVAAHGIPAAVPVEVEDDHRWLGAPFLVMPAIPGHVPDPTPLSDAWLTRAPVDLTTTLYSGYIDVVADINGIDWRTSGLAEVLPVRDDEAEIAFWREYLGWYGDGAVLVPALADALDWCESHRPATEPEPSLLWGDVRLGNIIFDEARAPAAVLDWEMATIGTAEHDLGWGLTLEALQDELLGRRVPGFLDQRDAIARYESRLGRSVQHLDWYGTFALVRSTAIMTRISYLHELAGQSPYLPIADNPVLDFLDRRISAAG